MSCESCNKKKVVIFYSCRCGLNKLCIKCVNSENHKCNFDYKKEGQNEIANNNPLIIADKLEMRLI